MLKRTLSALACALAMTFSMPAAAQESDFSPVDYVNPLVGTLSTFELSTGNTYPAIARPWGMNFWTPQTGEMGNGWQYVYTDNKIRGFKQTHQPSPWINDFGQFSIMPVVGAPVFDQDKRPRHTITRSTSPSMTSSRSSPQQTAPPSSASPSPTRRIRMW